MIMIGEVGIRSAVTSFLYVYVQDADATHERALNAGARSLEKPIDTPYGDRSLHDRRPVGKHLANCDSHGKVMTPTNSNVTT